MTDYRHLRIASRSSCRQYAYGIPRTRRYGLCGAFRNASPMRAGQEQVDGLCSAPDTADCGSWLRLADAAAARHGRWPAMASSRRSRRRGGCATTPRDYGIRPLAPGHYGGGKARVSVPFGFTLRARAWLSPAAFARPMARRRGRVAEVSVAFATSLPESRRRDEAPIRATNTQNRGKDRWGRALRQ